MKDTHIPIKLILDELVGEITKQADIFRNRQGGSAGSASQVITFSTNEANIMEAWFATPIICPVLIGRTPDLTTLRSLVDRAKGGQGRVALVSGEAGIGKSRLVAEVKTYAASHDFLLGMANTLGGDLFQAASYYRQAFALLQPFGTSRLCGDDF